MKLTRFETPLSFQSCKVFAAVWNLAEQSDRWNITKEKYPFYWNLSSVSAGTMVRNSAAGKLTLKHDIYFKERARQNDLVHGKSSAGSYSGYTVRLILRKILSCGTKTIFVNPALWICAFCSHFTRLRCEEQPYLIKGINMILTCLWENCTVHLCHAKSGAVELSPNLMKFQQGFHNIADETSVND